MLFLRKSLLQKAQQTLTQEESDMAIKKLTKSVPKTKTPPTPTRKPAKVKAGVSKGPREGTLTSAWNELFIQNETRVKNRQKGWTDAELIAKMQKAFPESANKTTILRISMVRACYNKGTSMFAAYGPAGKSGRPIAQQHGGSVNAAEQNKVVVKATVKAKANPQNEAPSKQKLKNEKKAKPTIVSNEEEAEAEEAEEAK